ncbi:MAG: SHOCT domain-containing protein [Candidatus Helarchaeota archaeon]
MEEKKIFSLKLIMAFGITSIILVIISWILLIVFVSLEFYMLNYSHLFYITYNDINFASLELSYDVVSVFFGFIFTFLILFCLILIWKPSLITIADRRISRKDSGIFLIIFSIFNIIIGVSGIYFIGDILGIVTGVLAIGNHYSISTNSKTHAATQSKIIPVKLLPEKTVPGQIKNQVPDDYCMNCGLRFKEDDKVCINCGKVRGYHVSTEQNEDPNQILKKRFAMGEITEEDYLRIKKILND